MFISHEGVAHDKNPPGRGSGRYAWGSGENPEQHQFDFLSEVKKLKARGETDAQIAEHLLGYKRKANGDYILDKNGNPKPYGVSDLRAKMSIESKRKMAANRQKAIELYDKYGNKTKVAEEMGVSEGTVRNLLNDTLKDRQDKYQSTADMLKKYCDQKGPLDVGKNVEYQLGVTENTKKVALKILEEEGYKIAYVPMPQLTTQNRTTVMVLVPPDYDYKSVFDVKNLQINSIGDYSDDGGKTWQTTKYPEVLDSSRVYIRYKEDGGALKDGVIELRKGVQDISLGDSLYSQVRINVDNKGYMKGMAMYADDIPEGYDLVYNTNKKRGTKVVPDLGEDGCVMKSLKTTSTGEIDRDNPFGALIKSGEAGGQSDYISEDGTKKQRVINKIQDEGDWDNWSKNLSAQFLSKQPMKLIKQQLDYTIADKKVQLDELSRLTNPVIKKQMLENFAGKCDSNAADLSALGFKNQAFQVMLPSLTLKDNECYAPNYKDGETVALVRYPHAGTFEIPILKVNNKNKEAKRVLANAKDAIMINANVAERLSGADFDGDTPLVIPMTSNNLQIKSTPPLEALQGWDNKEGYKLDPSQPTIKNKTKQLEMGKVTNLITDMTIAGADEDDIVKAVKHSMVVIDSEKHHLDYKQSYIDNDILSLKKEYQGGKGASTIISQAKSEAHIPKRTEVVDKYKMTEEEKVRFDNGEKIYHDTGEKKKKVIKDTSIMTEEELQRFNAGKKVWRETNELVTMKVNKIDTVSDAFELVRDKNNEKEVAYATFANELKALANEARKEARSIKTEKVDVNAKKTYASEVESLNNKVMEINKNSPKERQALTIANSMASEKEQSNPDMDYEHKQRMRSICLTKARKMVNASKPDIDITEKEWDAIQAGAVTSTTLTTLIKNMDQDKLVKLATPPKTRGLTDAQKNLAKTMKESGMYANAEIAERLGVSASTISKLE